MWWGFSEALDLINEIPGGSESPAEGDCEKHRTTYNILLVGQCDGRHMLKTIAQKYRHKDVDLKMYVYEPLLENVARELLFTTLALEPKETLGIAEKTLFFMELYGNTLLRPATSNYLIKASKRLLNMVTNTNYHEMILPHVTLNNLKYKERDQLEVIFKYWASKDNTFEILKAWDGRLRKHLGTRYDTRLGVFDWDYHMRYFPYGADPLKLHEYKTFREKGIAFYFEDTDPCVPNWTLASAIFSAGAKILNYGYLGDIVTGPYVSFGFDCEDTDMFKKVNNRIIKSATDFTQQNVLRMFHEIENKTPFVASDISDNSSMAIMADTSDQFKTLTLGSAQESESNCIRIKDAFEMYQFLDTNSSQIIFLSSTALKDYPKKPEYKNMFDVVFISQAMALKYISSELFKMFKPNCRVIVDTPKFLLHYRKEDLEKFKNDLIELMYKCNYKLIGNFNSETDNFARFTMDQSSGVSLDL